MYTITCTDEKYPFSYEVESLEIEDIFDTDGGFAETYECICEDADEISLNPSLPPYIRFDLVINQAKLIICNHLYNRIFFQENSTSRKTLYEFNPEKVYDHLFGEWGGDGDTCQGATAFIDYWIDFLSKGSWHIDYDKEEIWFGTDIPRSGWILSSTSTGIFFDSEHYCFPWRGVFLDDKDSKYESLFYIWVYYEWGHHLYPVEAYMEVLESCPINLGDLTRIDKDFFDSKLNVNEKQIMADVKAFFAKT